MLPVVKIKFEKSEDLFLVNLSYDIHQRLHVAFESEEDFNKALKLLPSKVSEINMNNGIVECVHEEQYLYNTDKETYRIELTASSLDVYVETKKEEVVKPDPVFEKIKKMQQEVLSLKKELSDGDYVIIKNYEAYLAGDLQAMNSERVKQMHVKRESVRAKINEIEKQLEIFAANE